MLTVSGVGGRQHTVLFNKCIFIAILPVCGFSSERQNVLSETKQASRVWVLPQISGPFHSFVATPWSVSENSR